MYSTSATYETLCAKPQRGLTAVALYIREMNSESRVLRAESRDSRAESRDSRAESRDS